MKISTDTIKLYGEKPGWYEGRVHKEDGRIKLSQGQNYAYLEVDPEKLERYIGEVIFVEGTLEINPRKEIFVLKDLKQFAKFLGRYRKRYLGKSDDRVIHSEKHSCEEIKQTDLLEDVKINGEVNFPLW